MKVHGFQTTTRVIDCDAIFFTIDIHTDSSLSTLGEKKSQIIDSGIFDFNFWIGCECSEYDKSPTFDIVMDDSSSRVFWGSLNAFDDDRMVMCDFDRYTDILEKMDEIEHMRFDRRELDRSFTSTKCCNHDDVFCGGDSKIG